MNNLSSYKIRRRHYKIYGFIIGLFIILSGNVFAQSVASSGFLKIRNADNWQITVDDTIALDRMAEPLVALPPGQHLLTAHPVNIKNWLVHAQTHHFHILPADTIVINLGKREENPQPRFTVFKNASGIRDGSVLQKSSNLKAYLKPALIITAVASNWASFYLKRKADDYYDIYLETSSLSKLNQYYDKSADFDAYASVMLGVSVAALSGYLYLLLTE